MKTVDLKKKRQMYRLRHMMKKEGHEVVRGCKIITLRGKGLSELSRRERAWVIRLIASHAHGVKKRAEACYCNKQKNN